MHTGVSVPRSVCNCCAKASYSDKRRLATTTNIAVCPRILLFLMLICLFFLLQSGNAYRCFCSAKRLQLLRRSKLQRQEKISILVRLSNYLTFFSVAEWKCIPVFLFRKAFAIVAQKPVTATRGASIR